VREAYAKTYEHHIPLRCEYRLIKSNGKVSWYLDEANVVRDEAGGSLFLQGILVDITQDKDIEQELFYYRQRLKELVGQRTAQLETQCEILKSANINLDKMLHELRQANSVSRVNEKYFRLLLETTDEGVVGIDAKGRCTFVNRAAQAMLGYAQEELSGQDLHKIIHQCNTEGSLIPADDWPVYSAFREYVPQRGAEFFRSKEGRFFPVEYSSCPMKLDEGVHGAVMVFRDATKSQALIQTLAHQASHDPLTGLINRTEFERRLDRVLKSAYSDQSEHVLCYLDLDHFKVVNDSCGHAAGDELLRTLSAMLTAKLRQRDTFARLGGDEFAILFEHLMLDQAVSIANELCESIRNYRFTWNGETFSVGASIGLKTLSSADRDADIILEAADAACYRAKKQGGNQVQVFKSDNDGHFYKKSRKSSMFVA
jgi:diguanylate cyclase (GGDEF)-like protein/PAS domain S-box-containing protein